MKVYLAADHAGFELKNTLITFVRDELGLEVIDCGANVLDPNDDYPEFIRAAATQVAGDSGSRGIVLGGSGTGEAIVANKVAGVRAVQYYGGNPEIISLSREHNDANVLSLGARFIDESEAKEVVRTWLELPFSGDERHVRRIAAIE